MPLLGPFDFIQKLLSAVGQQDMMLPSVLFCILLSDLVTHVSGLLLFNPLPDHIPGDLTARMGDPKTLLRNRDQRSSQGNLECQEGNPPGVTYSGRTSVTASGTSCQVWAESKPHEHDYTDVGESNHCRNPNGDSEGVWCYTTDPDKEWEHCSVPICAPMLKVLDFSADNDQKPDSNGEYTGATLDTSLSLPESFTICSAFMVEVWHTVFTSARMFTLLNDYGDIWGGIVMWEGYKFTSYYVDMYNDTATLRAQFKTQFFPLQWTRACFSLDSAGSQITLVVDGQLLGEADYRREEDKDRPTKLSLRLGSLIRPTDSQEYSGRTTDFNVFNSALPPEVMIDLTQAGGKKCGASGDLVSWEEAEWTLHSQARVIEVDREWKGPCRRESKVQVFTADFKYHPDCMEHCKKIKDGRVPPVNTEQDWENLKREVDLVTEDRSNLPMMWLSTTKGDIDRKLATLDHWPETEVVNNKTMKLEAAETIWRDFYTGQRLENWTKPYYFDSSKHSGGKGTERCILGYTSKPWDQSWRDRECHSYDMSCPCSYPVQPLLRLLGLCSTLIDPLYSPKQLPGNPGNMILAGALFTKIEFNDTSSQWVLTSSMSDVTAVSPVPKLSYALGKHKWTISNDVYECNEGKPYMTMLKLTGCREEGEFTCNDGQCIAMEERCDQLPDCRDKSDEVGCQLIVLENNYNKYIPPIRKAASGVVIPANVSISITLMKVVEIEEVDHSIHLQFQISLQWKENRLTYQNLKTETSLNALTDGDIRTIWLPLIVFDNTDQKEVTRLGENWEWATRVTVTREGDFTRSTSRVYSKEVDEAEMFKGAENRLTMNQTYTWEFQCQYELQRYPFDTQVIKHKVNNSTSVLLNEAQLSQI